MGDRRYWITVAILLLLIAGMLALMLHAILERWHAPPLHLH